MDYKFKTKPYAHQLKALKKSHNKELFAYFMEMGTGKSKVLIDNVSMLYDKGKINGFLLVAPKGVYKNWFDSEIPTHMVNHIDKKMVLWQANITKSQQLKLDSLFEPGEDLHILIMNVDAFSTSKGVEFAAKFLRCHRTMMAIDESTTIKNPDAKRSKHICSLGQYAKYKRILTGSPVTKSPLDLYKQCEFLGEGLLDFTSYYAFRTRYAILKTMNFGSHSAKVPVGYQNLQELSDKIALFSDRVLKEDCLDLPDYTYQKRIIQLSKEQQKIYDQMKNVALAQMDGKLMTTSTALVQLMRLQQITCGHFKADDGTLKIIKNERVNALMDILEEVEGKAIIWAHWRHDIDSIVKAIEKVYPGSVMTYYGSTSTEDNVMIYYSNGYDLEKRTQSEARINRIGQKRKMTYIDIICEKTVDERIVKALRKKINIASEVMGEELKQWI